METTDFVSYDLALKLKECGFDEPCDHYYTPEVWKAGYIEYPMLLWEQTAVNSNDIIYDGERFSAPTLWHAQKWLREKKELIILIGMTRIDDWFYGIYDKCGKCLKDDGTQRDCYEAALSAGIAAALELIKE